MTTVSPMLLVQLRQGGRAEDDLVLVLDGVPGQYRRADRRLGRGVAGFEEERDTLAVDLGVVVVVAVPRDDIGIVVEERERLRGRRVAGVQQVTEVPPVERRMRDQGLQAAAEGEGGHDQRHGQHGPQQGRAHRHRGAAPPRIEREAHPDHRRWREPADAAASTALDVLGPATLERAATRWGAPRYARARAIAPRPTMSTRRPTPSTVQSKANPRVGVDGPDGTERRERGERDGHGDGEQRSHHDRGKDADQTVSGDRRRARTEAAQNRGILLGVAKLAGHELKADQQGGEGGNPAEYAERDGQRLDRAIDLGLDRCDGVEAVGISGRCRPGELPLHRVDVAVSVVELEPVGDGAFVPLRRPRPLGPGPG